MVKKNLPASEGDVDLIPGSGQSPGEGNVNLLQYSCLENSMDRGAWQATVHSVTKGHLRCFQLLAIMNKNNIESFLFKILQNMSDLIMANIMDIAAYE